MLLGRGCLPLPLHLLSQRHFLHVPPAAGTALQHRCGHSARKAAPSQPCKILEVVRPVVGCGKHVGHALAPMSEMVAELHSCLWRDVIKVYYAVQSCMCALPRCGVRSAGELGEHCLRQALLLAHSRLQLVPNHVHCVHRLLKVLEHWCYLLCARFNGRQQVLELGLLPRQRQRAREDLRVHCRLLLLVLLLLLSLSSALLLLLLLLLLPPPLARSLLLLLLARRQRRRRACARRDWFTRRERRHPTQVLHTYGISAQSLGERSARSGSRTVNVSAGHAAHTSAPPKNSSTAYMKACCAR